MKLPALILTTILTFGSAGAVKAETFDFDNTVHEETTLAQGFFGNILHHKFRHHRRHHNHRRRIHRSNRHHLGNHRRVHHGDRRHHQRRRNFRHQNHGHLRGRGLRRVNFYR